MRKAGCKFVDGDNWVLCDHTGFKIRVSESTREWQGLRVWEPTLEFRNPQDYIQVPKEKIAASIVRPDNNYYEDPWANSFNSDFSYEFQV